ncbi:DUF2281 domain-containing protein [Candidatus Poribacteria bacterium]|nr:DUF2281 domain-containing protein [Candidatus Poribacteria bacterium]
MATLIERIVAEVSTLPNELQKEVLNYVEYLKNKIPEPTKEQRFLSLLIEQGLIDEIPSEAEESENDEDFEPILIQGKPLSETIIENRGPK